MRFKHIAIVGVGFIGGSFALAARRAGIADRISGWDSKEVLDQACERGVIDGVEYSFSAGRVSDADLIYLAAPVRAIIEFLRTRGSSLKAGAIVTDAGSTKREICRAASEALPERVSFVGGHPMAGSHNAGVEHAEADLFREAPYALVVDESNDRSNDRSIRAARSIADVVREIGAGPMMLTAEEHDRAVARLSHAPQLLATALACRVNEADLRLAGSGFAEMARLAGSRWSVWEDICRTNADEITSALDEVIGEMEAVRSSISSGDFDAVGAAFGEANGLMGRFQSTSKRRDAATVRPQEDDV